MPSKTAAAKLALAAIKTAIRKDRAKAYALPVAVNFFFRGVTPPWSGEHYTFQPGAGPDGAPGTHACLRAYGRLGKDGRKINDGATLAPDSVPGAAAAAAAHDPGYREMNAIAAAWADKPYTPGPRWGRDWITRRLSRGSATWTRADVRQMFDDIFGDIMAESKAGLLARVYHSTVRLLGGIVHDLGSNRRALLPAAACLVLAAGPGCQSVRDVADWIEGLPAPVELEPDGSPGAPPPPPATPPETPPETPPAASDAVPYASLAWRISRDRPAGPSPAIVARISSASQPSRRFDSSVHNEVAQAGFAADAATSRAASSAESGGGGGSEASAEQVDGVRPPGGKSRSGGGVADQRLTGLVGGKQRVAFPLVHSRKCRARGETASTVVQQTGANGRGLALA